MEPTQISTPQIVRETTRKSSAFGETIRLAFSVALIALTLVSVTSTVSAGEDKGEAGFIGSWLEVPIGARSAAMGQAFVSIGEGGYGQLHNPAGITSMENRQFTTSYRAMNIDRQLSYAAIAFPLPEDAAFGFSWLYADYGNVDTRTTGGLLTGGDIGQDEHQFGLTFAKRFSPRVSVGAMVSYYQWKLDEITTNSVLFNVGTILYIDHFLYDRETIGLGAITDIQVGLTVKSAGSSFIINTTEFYGQGSTNGSSIEAEVPRKVVLGISGRGLDGSLLLATDLEVHEVFGPRLRFGAEYEISEQLKLRSGLNNGTPAAGAGFRFNLGKTPLLIDYAFQGSRVGEGTEHIFSIDLSF